MTEILERMAPRIICACTSQFFGEFCEYEVDYCKDVDCKNNGTCLSDSRMRNFTCSCASRFS
uniref:EGF-like domain-containing protein n=1 Tax=Romanomermis culicivorax TaxID=13658 RepID=A0A915IXK9_ROMCU